MHTEKKITTKGRKKGVQDCLSINLSLVLWFAVITSLSGTAKFEKFQEVQKLHEHEVMQAQFQEGITTGDMVMQWLQLGTKHTSGKQWTQMQCDLCASCVKPKPQHNFSVP